MFQEKNSNYKGGNTNSKINCRLSFLNELSMLDVTDIRYVGLPALYPIVEGCISTTYPSTTLFLAEVNEDTYIQQKESMYQDLDQSTKVIHINDNIFSCVVPFEINAIWLDLCSMLSRSLMNNLISFIEGNQFDSEGVFALTVLGSRERSEHRNYYNDLERIYLNEHSQTLKHFRGVNFPRILCKILEKHLNRTVVLTNIIQYHPNEGKRGVNMCYYSFKWHKK